MIKISEKRLKQLKNNFNDKRIAVIGDMMLDIYYWGDVKRISPEAPVPVMEVENEFYRFGGAANCALNIAKLNGVPEPVGVIGYDNFGTVFNSLLSEQNISHHGIVEDDTRPTTAKTRVIADSQHIVRIDKESKETINKKIQNKIFDYVKSIILNLDGIILQDYNKGVLSSSLISQVIELANKNKKLITVDPKFNNFYEYKNVTVFKPNRNEAEAILGMKIKTDADISFAGNTLLKKLNVKNVLLTLGPLRERGVGSGAKYRMPSCALRRLSEWSRTRFVRVLESRARLRYERVPDESSAYAAASSNRRSMAASAGCVRKFARALAGATPACDPATRSPEIHALPAVCRRRWASSSPNILCRFRGRGCDRRSNSIRRVSSPRR